ncbi:MAG: 50S ribosomal protein L10 [Candidatus Latescibacterota bacterium]
MKKEEKNTIVGEFVTVFGLPGVYLMDFKGLNVAEITELRKKLREARISMKVVKNTLAKRALKEAGVENFDGYFTGPTGVVWSKEDSIIPARLLLEFLKNRSNGAIKAGLVDGAVIKAEQMEMVSKLPTKRELYAQVASVLNAPMVRLAVVLNAVPTKLVRTVDALREKKAGEPV